MVTNPSEERMFRTICVASRDRSFRFPKSFALATPLRSRSDVEEELPVGILDYSLPHNCQGRNILIDKAIWQAWLCRSYDNSGIEILAIPKPCFPSLSGHHIVVGP